MKLQTPASTRTTTSIAQEKILVRGIHLDLTPPLEQAATTKAARLLRHHPRIIRVRIDLEYDHARDQLARFVCSGRVEISGPDMIAHVASDQMYKSIDLLVDKLDRMLRERTRQRANRRNNRPEGTEFRDRLAVPA